MIVTVPVKGFFLLAGSGLDLACLEVVRIIPWGLISKAQARISAMGKPMITTRIRALATQSGIFRNWKVASAIYMSSQPVMAYTTATRYIFLFLSSSKKPDLLFSAIQLVENLCVK